MNFVFSPDYTVDIGRHTFPTRKFSDVAKYLEARGHCAEDPGEAPRELILRAHCAEWTDKILAGRVSLEEEARMELRWSAELARAHSKTVAGTLLAARKALGSGLGLHAGGGSHHAFYDFAEGFCVFNDLAAALLELRVEGAIRRGAVVDLDVHQGNGTAAILSGKEGLFTYSMHQDDIYPEEKPPSTLDVGLPAGTRDLKYLKLLKDTLPDFLDGTKPDLVVYQAGADVWEGDMLGGLSLTKDGIRARDEAVFRACGERGIAVAVTLGGGYAEKTEDTVEIHAQTLTTAIAAYRRNTRG
jgi:acetoin utilization deacetylase AcuC-like enzyme